MPESRIGVLLILALSFSSILTESRLSILLKFSRFASDSRKLFDEGGWRPGTFGGHQEDGGSQVPPYSLSLMSGSTISSNYSHVFVFTMTTLRLWISYRVLLIPLQAQTNAVETFSIKTLAAQHLNCIAITSPKDLRAVSGKFQGIANYRSTIRTCASTLPGMNMCSFMQNIMQVQTLTSNSGAKVNPSGYTVGLISKIGRNHLSRPQIVMNPDLYI